MKMMKLALLGTAALAVSAIGAQADDLDALKAEIQALNARVAQLETAPAVPAGYSLLTVSDIETLSLTGEQAKDKVGYSGSNRISVLPAADAPAAATIDWDFQVRTALLYIDYSEDGGDFDSEDGEFQVAVRGRIRVKATMDTAVGAVGTDFRLQGSGEFGGDGATTRMNIAWGWWQMTPEFQFGAGYTGSLGNVNYGQDEFITGVGTTVAFNPGDQEQMRLTWTSGPLTLAAAIEDSGADTLDSQVGHVSYIDDDHPSIPAFAGRATYAGDTISASVMGFWDDPDEAWQIGAGATAAIGDMATISVAAALGDNADRDDVDGDYGDYWGASIYGRLDVTEQTYVEASYGFLDSEAFLPHTTLGGDSDFTRQAFDAGIYHSPVDQLVFGLEANYLMINEDNENDNDTLTVAFISWFNL